LYENAPRKMETPMKTIVVAGHVCLEIIPALPEIAVSLDTLLAPGKLVNVGPAVIATGGAVANTGLALHRLGQPVRLVAKVGADAFGGVIRERFQALGAPVDGLKTDPAAATSYTVVLSPAGYDRIFLHCTGANNVFGAQDLPAAQLADASLLHFGYPPLMRRFYADGGGELRALLLKAKEAGLTTALDMALPDPLSPAGRADWPAILRQALPLVDIFTPSLDEIVFMLDRHRGANVRAQAARGVPLGGLTAADARQVADTLLAMGPAVVLLKLGAEGVYFQTSGELGRLKACGAAELDIAAWRGAFGHAPCYEVNVAGTTGSGDCTIAGFLAAVARGLPPGEAARMAVATGAASVEQPDATSGVPSWEALARRMQTGWRRKTPHTLFPRVE
jgi:sugar/nucleoside kinase (ribokinase family)